MDPEDEQLFNEIINDLYQKDSNCAYNGTDYDLDLQGSSSSHYDNASRPFFSYFNEDLLERPTYKTFLALMDNYVAGTGESENLNYEEVKENIDFIEAICETSLMQDFYEKILEHELYEKHDDEDEFTYNNLKQHLYITWFKLYSRNYQSQREGILDSSAFEHTFVGETKNSASGNGTPMGFHNWLRLYQLESSGELNYRVVLGR